MHCQVLCAGNLFGGGFGDADEEESPFFGDGGGRFGGCVAAVLYPNICDICPVSAPMCLNAPLRAFECVRRQ